jgi:hypothetical protein
MNNFQKTVLTISTIILIFSLVILAIFLSKSFYEESYPPVISDCPDYWDISLNPDGYIHCINNTDINLGELQDNGYPCDISHNINTTLCDKYTTAKECNLVWDGVTNNTKRCI